MEVIWSCFILLLELGIQILKFNIIGGLFVGNFVDIIFMQNGYIGVDYNVDIVDDDLDSDLESSGFCFLIMEFVD